MTSNLQSSISDLRSQCDLCGSTKARFCLTTPRLDGPLVQCEECKLFYIAMPAVPTPTDLPVQPAAAIVPVVSESEIAVAEMVRLATRAQELALVEPTVEEREHKWREITAAERMNDLLRVTAIKNKGGRLLEIGSSTGEFLAAASSIFKVTGVEADAASYAIARARGFNCFNGTLFGAQLPNAHFDIVTLYHVIEHFPSPQQVLKEIHRILWPKGWLVIETPNIATIWYSLLGKRWRQFIPDHRFFFTPDTIRRICVENGFEVVAIQSVSKAMSLRLFISRVGRYHKPTAQLLAKWSDALHLSDKTLYLNLGDVMRVYARRK
ncbi:MAG: class I SAM-dependent methyltransferase [Acidobacteria bacterium]|nr:class I SAM-dependent methyltransferase [Acidobacteriota bacterium]